MIEGNRESRPNLKELLLMLERPQVGIPLSDETRRKEFRMKEPVIEAIRKSREVLEELGRQRYANEYDLRLFGSHYARQINHNLEGGIYADLIITRVKYEPPAPHETLATMSFTTYFAMIDREAPHALKVESAPPQLEAFSLRFEFTPEMLRDIYRPVRWVAERVAVFGTNTVIEGFLYRHCLDRNKDEDIENEHTYSFIYLPWELESAHRA